MHRFFLFAIVISAVFSGLSAQSPSAHDPGIKLGIQAGYPSAVTVGFRLDKDFEFNVLAGTNYSLFTVGVNGLFRIVSPIIADDVFPVSLGPQVILDVGTGAPQLSALALIRIENTMRTAPLNFFLEAGLGAQIIPVTSFTGTGAVGIRFVFGHPAVKTAD